MIGSNYSPLQRNTLDGLSETAGVLYMRLLDAFEAHKAAANERRAFLAACDYDERAGTTLDYILRYSPMNVDDKTRSELSAFFATRWRNNFMGAGA